MDEHSKRREEECAANKTRDIRGVNPPHKDPTMAEDPAVWDDADILVSDEWSV